MRYLQQQARHVKLQRFAQTVTLVGAIALALAGLAGGYGVLLWEGGAAVAAQAVFLAVAGFLLFACFSFLYARLILAGVADEDRSLHASLRIRETIDQMDVFFAKRAQNPDAAGGAVSAT
tara:strand:- start:1486 stop:1845 length:360 start_codon:yes stop_codon:yes gene_type:complete